MYRVREVDGSDDDVADTLSELHRLTFFDGASVPKFDHGHWWLARCEAEPVAFAGIIPSTHVPNAGYFCRVGVLSKHPGRSLQLRLMRALEARARLNGWCLVISDTTDNVSSANNFIRGGLSNFFSDPFHGLGHTHCIGAGSFDSIGFVRYLPDFSIRPVAVWLPGIFLFRAQVV